MKTPHRLLLVAALITAEIICAQTAPAGGPERGGPRGPGGPGGPGRFHPVIRALDADKDGEISSAEIANAPAALSALDADKDGTVTIAELRPAHPARRGTPPADAPARPARPARPDGASQPSADHSRPIDPVMLALDANADHALSAAEIANAAASLKALDANADGKLTRDELRPLPPVE
jgi:Ca2+-binding EF-hand superfamily protein